MTTSSAIAASSGVATDVRRLLVTTQDPQSRTYQPVGFLTRVRDDDYRFGYLRSAVSAPWFRAIPGLSRAQQGELRSATLFPTFAVRVISARRPDISTTLDALALAPDADPFEILERSHGTRVGDRMELLPAPNADDDGNISFTFLSHGVRHLDPWEQDRIDSLQPGQPLRLRPEPSNPVNPHAQLVTDGDNVRLGWVPDPLLEPIGRLADLKLTVEKQNSADVGFHLRLLVRVDGRLTPGDALFGGPEWATVE